MRSPLLRSLFGTLSLALLSCGGPSTTSGGGGGGGGTQVGPPPAPILLTIVGTNDLHGHIEALPMLGGYLRNLRAAREAEGGGVVLLDGGDMFQGTLESNLAEGAPVVAAYNALGYDAAAIGNHEFDYGPAGDAVSARSPEEDPRGALRARAAEARFPFLSANLRVGEAPPEWENVRGAALFERAGIRVGVIGLSTVDTPGTTLASNVRDLRFLPLASSVLEQSARLRDQGAQLVFVTAHAGGVCERTEDPHDLGSCRPGEEIFALAEALPRGTIDAIVAGHTHQVVAHFVNDIPIVESHSYGRAFGRIDLRFDPERGEVVERTIHPPRDLCGEAADFEGCAPEEYEGRPVAADEALAALLAPAVESARARREEPLGVRATGPIVAVRERECPLGNLFVDLMLRARPDAAVALTNGGGLRAELPAGDLRYGHFYESTPFDNRFARVQITGAELAELVRRNLEGDGSFYSLGGVHADARCANGRLEVRLTRASNGRRIRDQDRLELITSDFLALRGEGLTGRGTDEVRIEEGELAREAMVGALRQWGPELRPESLYDPAHPRIRYEGERPLRCGGEGE